jgi:hypothetical protein
LATNTSQIQTDSSGIQANGGRPEAAGETGNSAQGGTEWPNCGFIDSICTAYQLADTIGPDIFQTIMSFALSARDGSRLTLQRNRNGFSAQVVGPVKRGALAPVDLESMKLLSREIDEATKEAASNH